jgi:hypothetical protein
MKFLLTIILIAMLTSCGGVYDERIADLEFKLNQLTEEKEILRTVNRLFIGTDNRDWETVKNVFTEEVLFDMTSMTGGEPSMLTSRQIIDAWDQGLKALESLHHQTGNYDVNVDGDQAEVFCYGTAIHYLPNKTNRNTRTFVGSYNLHLNKIHNEWKIDRFKFNLKFIDGNIDLDK